MGEAALAAVDIANLLPLLLLLLRLLLGVLLLLLLPVGVLLLDVLVVFFRGVLCGDDAFFFAEATMCWANESANIVPFTDVAPSVFFFFFFLPLVVSRGELLPLLPGALRPTPSGDAGALVCTCAWKRAHVSEMTNR